nr:hypothetical protein [Spelaeibacter cavernicola]
MSDAHTRHELAQAVAADALLCGPTAFETWNTDIESVFGDVDGLLGHVGARWYTAFYSLLDAEFEMQGEPDIATTWDRLAEIHPGYRALLEIGSTNQAVLESFAYQCDRVEKTTGFDMRAALATRYPRAWVPDSEPSTTGAGLVSRLLRRGPRKSPELLDTERGAVDAPATFCRLRQDHPRPLGLGGIAG